MNVVIRSAEPGDCAGISHIHRNSGDPWSDAVECWAWVEKRLERGFYVQTAEADGRLVGHGEWIVSDEPGGRFLYLGMLEIDGDYQRAGIGRKMIADGIRYARENNCAEIVTIPDSDNTSIIFYEKCGFKKRRAIKSCSIETKELHSRSKHSEKLISIPQSILKELPFVSGLVQVSARHMWEICNHKPITDDRLTPAVRLEKGSYAQLSYFDDGDSALALYWSKNPCERDLAEILDLGYNCGMKSISFKFFEEYEHLFPREKIEPSDIEIYMPF